MKTKIKNAKRYAQIIRASFQKFLGFYEHHSLPESEKDKMREELVREAEEVIKSSDKKIVDTFPGNFKNQTSLRLVRLFNKEKEIEKEGNRVRRIFRQLLIP